MSKIESYLAMAGMAMMAEAINTKLIYDNSNSKSIYRKSPLSKKQLKARKKSKNAKQQRKKGRS